MEWAIVTWGVLIGMVGLLWIMVVAVVQDAGDLSAGEEDHEESVTSERSTEARQAA